MDYKHLRGVQAMDYKHLGGVQVMDCKHLHMGSMSWITNIYTWDPGHRVPTLTHGMQDMDYKHLHTGSRSWITNIFVGSRPWITNIYARSRSWITNIYTLGPDHGLQIFTHEVQAMEYKHLHMGFRPWSTKNYVDYNGEKKCFNGMKHSFDL